MRTKIVNYDYILLLISNFLFQFKINLPFLVLKNNLKNQFCSIKTKQDFKTFNNIINKKLCAEF
ncbi:hypothetical protein B0A58_15725 [Flavobacterium branchiophilum NBRC 15030 = ATCC 35035]|nr:hypothetical protein B0A58_15725 [Flavobacterium branchiophilum NBRC 15030 = ATCC 35035]